MKFARFLFINLLLATSILVAFPQPGSAQQANNIDRKRMSRDLDIMDGILGKLFSNEDSHTHFPMSNNVDGSYLPGYGVMFRVPSDLFTSPFRYFRIKQVTDNIQQVKEHIKQEQEHIKQEQERVKQEQERLKAKGEKGDTVNLPAPPALPSPPDFGVALSTDTSSYGLTKKEIIDRAVTFLSDYADAIGQLQSTDHVTIDIERSWNTYFLRPSMNEAGTTYSSSGTDDNKDIYISSRKSDITAHRTGKISDAVFRSRISVSDGTANSQQTREFDIMSNILESAFKDSRIRNIVPNGDVSFSYLPDYGVIYYMQAGLKLGYFISNLNPSDLKAVVVTGRSNTSNSRTTVAAKKAYDDFLNEVSETLIDYGRTLHALKPGQQLLLSIGTNEASDNIPAHVMFQVSQKTLSDYDAGKISRDQALKDITVTKYD